MWAASSASRSRWPRAAARSTASGRSIRVLEVITAPYVERERRRRTRHLTPIEELRANTPKLAEETRRAFERIEVFLAFDLPVDLGEFAANLRRLLDRYVEDVLALFTDNLRRYPAGEPLRNVVVDAEV
jgi:hypothetical protein